MSNCQSEFVLECDTDFTLKKNAKPPSEREIFGDKFKILSPKTDHSFCGLVSEKWLWLVIIVAVLDCLSHPDNVIIRRCSLVFSFISFLSLSLSPLYLSGEQNSSLGLFCFTRFFLSACACILFR